MISPSTSPGKILPEFIKKEKEIIFPQ